MQTSEQIARRVASCDEAVTHVLYRKFPAQSVFGKDLLQGAQILQLLRANVA